MEKQNKNALESGGTAWYDEYNQEEKERPSPAASEKEW